ncbi:MAG: Flagellar FliJ protein [Deltaproteobacteria bacterium ADurb.BinA179]|jgi:flagellar export protein FliJ|nr:flagellar export protein FliJ [Deltaproteobacteria bacterium]MDI9541354.1 flagellar export protein FliJ [Pseudomonadota bacterium]OPZ28622.1 MAG: Flagellar FliJ protein [Deltaproteobacteria bacterium ADurb.BinA179]HOD70711.1 flagellar export protein FliJ [Deltaproteobacteria bacterium]HON61679.1 flagellar export protein FliJ [Deltaproteobacteria bacterium]
MGFRFRFETLLRVRKIREDLAMQEFSKIQKHLKDLEMLKSFNESKRSDTRQQFIQKIDAGLKSADIATYQSYLSRLDAEIGQLDKLIIQAGRQLDTKREELLKAKKEFKAMERLREIDEQRYRTRQQKDDMRFMDELAILRYGSRQ